MELSNRYGASLSSAQFSFFYMPQSFLIMFTLISKKIVKFLSYFLPEHYVRNITIFLVTLPRDMRTIFTTLQILFDTYYYKIRNRTALTEFQKIVKKYPDKGCILYNDTVWTLKDIDTNSNKIAQVFFNYGYRKGDVIALLMTNRPEYVCIWLGLGKLGVVSALINTNLRSSSLIHCINTAKSKAIVYSEDFTQVILEARPSLGSNIRYFQLGGQTIEGITKLDNSLKAAPDHAPAIPYKIDYKDHLMYIYTSGTTGFPKAAIMPHSRFLFMSASLRHLLGLTKQDIVYNPLPLYHTAGGLLGISAGITLGATVVIRTKFSASSYIPECIKYNCTVGQYIGEICRYLLAVPPHPTDVQHKLRVIVGNGLRPAIWAKFVERFNVPNVMEVYGSTEGNLQFANLDNTIGAVGSIPRFLPGSHYIGSIIKVDMTTMEPIRNENGFCVQCGVDEPGMFIGIIPWKNSVKEVFGYLDKSESNKKFIYNVFKKGDRAFVSGDILVMDEFGYLYFKDRTGDTFRWKGENVSTSEVEAVVSSVIGLRDCIVYGVQVGDMEGRAGMAAIVDPKGQLDLNELAHSLDTALPKYAHPIFIRILPEIELTGTFKLKKGHFQEEGFNLDVVKDPLYFRKCESYIKLTKKLYDDICCGAIHI